MIVALSVAHFNKYFIQIRRDFGKKGSYLLNVLCPLDGAEGIHSDPYCALFWVIRFASDHVSQIAFSSVATEP